MKLQLISALMATTLLSGCSPTEEKEVKMACAVIMTDEEMSREVSLQSISADDYCSCAAKTIVTMPEADRAKAIPTILMVAQEMRENGGSAELVFKDVRQAADASDATPDAQAAYENMDALGEQLEEILDDMTSSNGQCSAKT
jgi:nucleosome binding factor SPN SPT16 subunit